MWARRIGSRLHLPANGHLHCMSILDHLVPDLAPPPVLLHDWLIRFLILFLMSSGNIASGAVRVYGVEK